MIGSEILNVAKPHIGEQYVLGARAHLTNPNHKGPWDCAEFTSWCTYQAYGIVFGTFGKDPRKADAYSGEWYNDGVDSNTLIDVDVALATPGAFVVRRPGDYNTRIGHVAISLGDGTLYEARDSNHGVVHSSNAHDRNWTSGVLVPGVLYTTGASLTPYALNSNIIRIESPFQRGNRVKKVQQALDVKGYKLSTIDGIYGPETEAAVVNFQASEGLLVDGEVGPQTAGALGLGWPI